ncbi:MAG: hypothetical protein K2H40_07735 [Lachnospiraceae bacterium]|nr:hypothetical protein [Lachnospiraceae bacterium]
MKKIVISIFMILCVSMLGNLSIYAQEAEELPEAYYQLLNSSMATAEEGREYTKDEIRENEDISLLFRTIICGDFEDIPWGRLPWELEQERYFEEYKKKGTWQFLIKDLNGDGNEELLLRNEEGQWLIFYEVMDGSADLAGRFYLYTLGEKRYSIAEMLKDEQMLVFGDIYLNDSTHVDIIKYKSNGHTDIRIQLKKDNPSRWLYDDLGGCIIRIIDDYDEYQLHVEDGEVADYLMKDMKNIDRKGIYYFIDGEMVTAQEAQKWFEDNIEQKIIPAEDWGIVP